MGVRTCYLNCYHNYSFAHIAQGHMNDLFILSQPITRPPLEPLPLIQSGILVVQKEVSNSITNQIHESGLQDVTVTSYGSGERHTHARRGVRAAPRDAMSRNQPRDASETLRL